jgi:Cys-tRNA(Pro)/Cys-tRNA(Cys) deacylase
LGAEYAPLHLLSRLFFNRYTTMKTIAARTLDQLKISYELRAYEVSENELDAVSVARKVDMPPEATFKTLVARGDKTGVMLACVPSDAELDLKKLAAATGDKKVEMVAVKEIQSLTGYIRGGVSPLGSKKKYPLYLDRSAIGHERISASAGRRGLQMILAPDDLRRAANAAIADLAKPASK